MRRRPAEISGGPPRREHRTDGGGRGSPAVFSLSLSFSLFEGGAPYRPSRYACTAFAIASATS